LGEEWDENSGRRELKKLGPVKPTANVPDIDGELARYKKRHSGKIDYTLVDSETAKVWG
jgi:hypothetical protein